MSEINIGEIAEILDDGDPYHRRVVDDRVLSKSMGIVLGDILNNYGYRADILTVAGTVWDELDEPSHEIQTRSEVIVTTLGLPESDRPDSGIDIHHIRLTEGEGSALPSSTRQLLEALPFGQFTSFDERITDEKQQEYEEFLTGMTSFILNSADIDLKS